MYYSPIFPRPYSGSHYFSSTSPTTEPSQMWQTSANNNADDFDSPKSGALPTFQKITSSPFYSNGRNPHMGYTTQSVSRDYWFSQPRIFIGYMRNFSWFELSVKGYSSNNFFLVFLYSMIPGRIRTKRIVLPLGMVRQQAQQTLRAAVSMLRPQLHWVQVSSPSSLHLFCS